jgi:hypothetical protein
MRLKRSDRTPRSALQGQWLARVLLRNYGEFGNDHRMAQAKVREDLT